LICGLLLCLAALVSPSASAHPLAPALLEVEELADGTANVLWKTSNLRLPGASVFPRLPSHCAMASQPRGTERSNSITTRWKVDCRPTGLIGQAIGVEGLGTAKTDALVRVKLADGRVVRGVLRAEEPAFTIPERESALQIGGAYLRMGFDHILSGADHLLFVLGLLLLVRGLRPLVLTITAFTLGHSITLSLAALGLTNLPSSLIEVVIALTILVLALELVREEGARESWMRRRPWVMSSVFGLLHGLGFASALREIGLPEHEIPFSLLSFNIGIELGQLFFVFGVLALRRLLSGRLRAAPRWISDVPAYAMGSLSTFWIFQRVALLLP
jgi:hydrogenase/urease accessory protein HupE